MENRSRDQNEMSTRVRKLLSFGEEISTRKVSVWEKALRCKVEFHLREVSFLNAQRAKAQITCYIYRDPEYELESKLGAKMQPETWWAIATLFGVSAFVRSFNVIFYHGILRTFSSRSTVKKTSDNYLQKWLLFELCRFRPGNYEKAAMSKVVSTFETQTAKRSYNFLQVYAVFNCVKMSFSPFSMIYDYDGIETRKRPIFYEKRIEH